MAGRCILEVRAGCRREPDRRLLGAIKVGLAGGDDLPGSSSSPPSSLSASCCMTTARRRGSASLSLTDQKMVCWSRDAPSGAKRMSWGGFYKARLLVPETFSTNQQFLISPLTFLVPNFHLLPALAGNALSGPLVGSPLPLILWLLLHGRSPRHSSRLTWT